MAPRGKVAISAAGESSNGALGEGDEERGTKRKRAAYSCTECSKGKARCDRQQPCGRCMSRRIPHLCHYLLSGYEDPVEVARDVRERLTRIEGLLLDGVSTRKEDSKVIEASAGSVPSPPPSKPGQPSSDSQRGGFVTRGRYYGPSAMSHVGDGSALDIMRALNVPDPETPEMSQNLGDRRPPRALVDILHELPARNMCDTLVQLYFDNINLTRYPIRQTIFTDTYEALWSAMGTFSLDPWLIHRLSLVFVVLAISALSAPADILRIDGSLPKAQEAEQRLAKANELFSASRRAAAYSDGLIQGRGDLMLVVSDLLTVRYLILVRRAPDALPSLGSAVYRAQGLGLHRNQAIVGQGISEDEVQDRRLIWSYVYHMDRYCALLLGRPLGISDKFCDVEPPSNLDDSGVEQPLMQVTLNSFLVFRHSLSMIMSRVGNEAFALKEPSYSTIADIDADLRAWAASLPAGLRLRTYGQTDEDVAAHPALATHRYLLSTEYNFVRISMHRPYLARVDLEGQYKSSREACLQAAMDDLWARTIFPLPGLENLSTGSYRVTNSLVILGISMLLDPPPETLQAIQQCLSSFIASRRGNNNLLDAIKIKEVAMVELLQMKADQSLIKAQSRATSPHPMFQPGDMLSGGNGGFPIGTWEPDTTALDPGLQSFFDQFWGPDALGDMGNAGDFGSTGGNGVWDSLNALLGIGGSSVEDGVPPAGV